MKILLATYWPLPHLGGVWPFMEQIKRKLEQQGHTVDIMGNGPDVPKYHIVHSNREISKDYLLPMLRTKLNASVHPILHADSLINHVETDRYCMELAAAYFGVDQYDVIHTQDVISTLALNRVRHKKTALVANIHGSLAREVKVALSKQYPQLNLQESLVWKYYHALEHYGATSSDMTITSSNWLKNILVGDFNVPSDHITVFQYGLDMDHYNLQLQQGTPIQRPAGKKVIICPARLVYIKGIHFLISALANLKLVRNDWVCWIVGEGDMKAELQLQVGNLGLHQDVLFLGQRSDVPALMAMSDIFAHPSIQDNQPFSVMEAQVAGLPSVVSNAGGLPEIVEHGKTGFVSAVGDVDALFRHFNLLLDNDVLRQNMSNNARQWGNHHWSLDTMIERTLLVYRTAMFHNAKRVGE